MKRSAVADRDYLMGVDPPFANKVFSIACYWVNRCHWQGMGHSDIEKIKADGTRIIVYVPPKNIPKGGNFRLDLPAKIVFAHWSKPVEATKAVTPSKHSIELNDKHGGFWAVDYRGIKPLRGAPTLWMYIPEVEA